MWLLYACTVESGSACCQCLCINQRGKLNMTTTVFNMFKLYNLNILLACRHEMWQSLAHCIQLTRAGPRLQEELLWICALFGLLNAYVLLVSDLQMPLDRDLLFPFAKFGMCSICFTFSMILTLLFLCSWPSVLWVCGQDGAACSRGRCRAGRMEMPLVCALYRSLLGSMCSSVRGGKVEMANVQACH